TEYTLILFTRLLFNFSKVLEKRGFKSSPSELSLKAKASFSLKLCLPLIPRVTRVPASTSSNFQYISPSDSAKVGLCTTSCSMLLSMSTLLVCISPSPSSSLFQVNPPPSPLTTGLYLTMMSSVSFLQGPQDSQL